MQAGSFFPRTLVRTAAPVQNTHVFFHHVINHIAFLALRCSPRSGPTSLRGTIRERATTFFSRGGSKLPAGASLSLPPRRREPRAEGAILHPLPSVAAWNPRSVRLIACPVPLDGKPPAAPAATKGLSHPKKISNLENVQTGFLSRCRRAARALGINKFIKTVAAQQTSHA